MESFYFTFVEGGINHGYYAEVLASTLEEAQAGIEAGFPGQWQGGHTAEDFFSPPLSEEEQPIGPTMADGLRKLVALHKIDDAWKVKQAGW